MSMLAIPEGIYAKAIAAAEALYRVSETSGFDPVLKDELRKRSIEIITALASVAKSFLPRPDQFSALAGSVAGLEALIRFSVEIGFMHRDNAERILGAYRQIQEWLQSMQIDATTGPSAAPRAEEILEMASFSGRESDRESSTHFSSVDRPSSNSVASQAEAGEELEPLILNDRQVRIIQFFEQEGRAQIGAIREIFGDECSEKTLQRDLGQLVEYGYLKRTGDYRWTMYLTGSSKESPESL